MLRVNSPRSQRAKRTVNSPRSQQAKSSVSSRPPAPSLTMQRSASARSTQADGQTIPRSAASCSSLQPPASRVLPRHKRRDDNRLAPCSADSPGRTFPPADRLVSACSFPVLPSLTLNLKGATHAASAHVQVPQTLATRPQTLSHYDQLNQLQEAMRDKLRSETAALSEQLALALARAECAEAQLKDLLESRRRSTVPAAAPVPMAAVAEEAVAEAAALRSEVERLQAEAATLRRTMLYERQQASRANSALHRAERGA